jgi:predicted PurR-regulated permease PerM
MPDNGYTQYQNDRRASVFSPASRINLIILCILLFIFSAVLLTEYLTSIVCMLAAALLLTYILLGSVNLFEGWILNLRIRGRSMSHSLARALAVVMVYLLFFGSVAIAIFRVAPPLATQIKDFAQEVPSYLSHMSENQSTHNPSTKTPIAELVQESLKKSREQDSTETGTVTTETTVQQKIRIREPLGKPAKKPLYRLALEQIVANYKNYASRLGGMLLDIGGATLSSLIYGLTTLVMVFYLLHDGKELQKGLVSLVPERHEANFERFLIRLHVQFHTIVKGQVFMSLLSGGLMYALLLLLGVKFALLLSVLFGVTSILPVIGPWLGLVPIITLLAFSSHPLDILQVLLASGLFYIVKTYWLWPKLIRRKYDIHPILFTLSFVACLKLAGLLGILLSFPLASVLGVVAASMREKHALAEKLQTSEEATP